MTHRSQRHEDARCLKIVAASAVGTLAIGLAAFTALDAGGNGRFVVGTVDTETGKLELQGVELTGVGSNGRRVWVHQVRGPDRSRVSVSQVEVRVPPAEEPKIHDSRSRAPVVYLDGVRMQEYESVEEIVARNDVEEIEIVKGKIAEVRYGSEAGNGVVVITTKGDKSEVRVRSPGGSR